MSVITDLPEHIGDFGTEFNYAVWTEDTTVTICNVNWDNSYRDIVGFNSRAELNAHIDGLATASIQLTDVSYVKTHEPIYLDIPFNVANKFNYLRASNPAQPIGGDEARDFYYFILGVEHVAGNTTRFLLQLDVWQSFGYDVNIGNVYVEQGHVGIANENNFDNYGCDYLTEPENINIGTNYNVVAYKRKTYMRTQDVDNEDIRDFVTLVVTSVSLESDSFGSITEPNMDSATGGIIDGIPTGADVYIVHNIAIFNRGLKEYPWIAQGIQAMYAVPRTVLNDAFGRTRTIDIDTPINTRISKFAATNRGLANNTVINFYDDWRERMVFDGREPIIPQRYRHLKKLYTSPYLVIEFTDYAGNSIVIRPELWNHKDAAVMEKINIIRPNPRIQLSPHRYMATGATRAEFQDIVSRNVIEDGGDYSNTSLNISGFPEFTIVNDNAMLTQASSAHSVQASIDSLGWGQQKALSGSQLSYDQATMGINTANSMTDLANSTAGALNTQANQHSYNQARTSMAMGLGGGAILGAATGGVAGAALGALGGAGAALNTALNHNMSVDNNNANLAISQANNSASNRISGQQAEYVRDSNKSLADYAAKGDYSQAIKAINAQTKDLETISPSSIGQSGGDLLNFASHGVVFTMKFKMVTKAAMRTIGEYWLRYGYTVNAFMQFPGLHVMEKFTYWRLSETYMHANIPESYKTTIRGIFEKGVTVWRNPNEIGMIDTADNKALKGISY